MERGQNYLEELFDLFPRIKLLIEKNTNTNINEYISFFLISLSSIRDVDWLCLKTDLVKSEVDLPELIEMISNTNKRNTLSSLFTNKIEENWQFIQNDLHKNRIQEFSDEEIDELEQEKLEEEERE